MFYLHTPLHRRIPPSQQDGRHQEEAGRPQRGDWPRRGEGKRRRGDPECRQPEGGRDGGEAEEAAAMEEMKLLEMAHDDTDGQGKEKFQLSRNN